MEPNTIAIPPRLAAVAFGVAGVLLAAPVPPHPDILHGGVAPLVLASGPWTVMHLSMAFASLLTIVGAAGIVAAHPDRLRPYGMPVLGAIVVGCVLMSGVMVLEAVAFPVLAAQDSQSLEMSGPMFGALSLRVVSVLAGLYPVGLAVLGLLCSRSTLSRPAGRALLWSMVGWLTFGLFFVPVLDLVACAAVIVAHAWWAVLLWPSRSAAVTPARAAGPAVTPTVMQP